MNIRRFSTFEKLVAGVAGLIVEHLAHDEHAPVAIMLSGGRTPRPVFEAVASSHTNVPAGVHILFSDERMVPDDSPESNYSHAVGMLKAIGIPDSRVMRVHTHLPLQAAADQYNRDIDAFIGSGGRVILGLLGIGADGHTASLFTADDLERGKARWAISVPREDFQRVSVTPKLLNTVQRIVFLVSGPDKEAIVEKLVAKPESVTAGLAVANHPNVELWVV